ncbi:hypothetical protein AAW14_20185 [Streptomyces hygroscopicus]|uniref:AraC family transcriptional regulator n=1 Tax=Streptomyces hygroscopicus TaxID=1912 RepID=UPI00223F935B|nr:AraC family transcriptional regulator [Streptomyces hygroscopicus]MCW7944289.1 hypothetical protein [Streptomyces hygroscopicus]
MPVAEYPEYVVEQTDTAPLPAGDPAKFWAEHVCRNQGTLRFRFADPATFRGGTVVQRYGGYQLIDFWSEGIVYSRTRMDIRSDSDDSLRLLVPTAGTLRLGQAGVTVQAGPKSAGLVTKARPFDVGHTQWARAWVMTMPAGALPLDKHAGPTVLNLGHGMGSVVRGMITELGAQRQALDGAAFASVCDTITELLALCIHPRNELPSTLAAVDAAVRDYVRRHAADPDLTPAEIARALGWSLRQVQLALHHYGTTPSRLLRTTRLDLARRLLCEAPSQLTIAGIAHASGFRSLSAFGASFKARFGVTPQEARTSKGSGGRPQ